MRLKKRLPGSTEKTAEYLKTLPKVYLVACWARYGTRDYRFAGKFVNKNGQPVPLVYDYDDFNGTCDYYWLRPLTHVTTGFIAGWTFSKKVAEAAAEQLNKELEHHD